MGVPPELIEGAEPLARDLWAKAQASERAPKDLFIEAVQIGWMEGVRAVLALAGSGVQSIIDAKAARDSDA